MGQTRETEGKALIILLTQTFTQFQCTATRWMIPLNRAFSTLELGKACLCIQRIEHKSLWMFRNCRRAKKRWTPQPDRRRLVISSQGLYIITNSQTSLTSVHYSGEDMLAIMFPHLYDNFEDEDDPDSSMDVEPVASTSAQ